MPRRTQICKNVPITLHGACLKPKYRAFERCWCQPRHPAKKLGEISLGLIVLIKIDLFVPEIKTYSLNCFRIWQAVTNKKNQANRTDNYLVT